MAIGVAALGVFHFDEAGAEVQKQSSQNGAGQHPGTVENHDSIQGQGLQRDASLGSRVIHGSAHVGGRRP